MCILCVESQQTSKQKETASHHCLLYVCIFEHVCLTENWAFIELMNNLIDLLFHDNFFIVYNKDGF